MMKTIIQHIIQNRMKLLLLFMALTLSSSAQLNGSIEIINKTICMDNKMVDSILDALRKIESSNGKRLLNINRDKYGKEISRDEGPYQLNNANYILFADSYNDGKKYNPYDEWQSRRIARQLLIDYYNFTGTWFDAIVAYNCGIGTWSRKMVPKKSIEFAIAVMKEMR